MINDVSCSDTMFFLLAIFNKKEVSMFKVILVLIIFAIVDRAFE